MSTGSKCEHEQKIKWNIWLLLKHSRDASLGAIKSTWKTWQLQWGIRVSLINRVHVILVIWGIISFLSFQLSNRRELSPKLSQLEFKGKWWKCLFCRSWNLEFFGKIMGTCLAVHSLTADCSLCRSTAIAAWSLQDQTWEEKVLT